MEPFFLPNPDPQIPYPGSYLGTSNFLFHSGLIQSMGIPLPPQSDCKSAAFFRLPDTMAANVSSKEAPASMAWAEKAVQRRARA